jgi:hypothetical protein
MISRRAALFAFATSLAPYAVPAALLPSGAAAQAATRATAHQRIRDIDVGIANWTTYIRQLYDRRDPNAYASDAIYRAQFDAWVQGEAASANAYLSGLQQERAGWIAWLNSNPIPEERCDPNVPSFCGLERTENWPR